MTHKSFESWGTVPSSFLAKGPWLRHASFGDIVNTKIEIIHKVSDVLNYACV